MSAKLFRPKKTARFKEHKAKNKTLTELVQESLLEIPPPVQKIIISYTLPRLPIGKFDFGNFPPGSVTSSDKYIFLANSHTLKVFSLDGNFVLLKEFRIQPKTRLTREQLYEWYECIPAIVSIASSNERLIIMHFNNYGISFIDLTQPIETWKLFDKWYYWAKCWNGQSKPEIKDKSEKKWSHACGPCTIYDDTLIISDSEERKLEHYAIDTTKNTLNLSEIEWKSCQMKNIPIEITNIPIPSYAPPDSRFRHKVHKNYVISGEALFKDEDGVDNNPQKHRQYSLIIYDYLKQQIHQVMMFELAIRTFHIIDDHILVTFSISPIIHILSILL